MVSSCANHHIARPDPDAIDPDAIDPDALRNVHPFTDMSKGIPLVLRTQATCCLGHPPPAGDEFTVR